MRQDAQKQAQKFCARKTEEKRKPHPIWAKKGETGCVLGAGEGCGRCGRVGEPEIRTNVNPTPIQHVQKENRRKPRVSAGFVAGAEGLVSAAASVGAGRSPQATSAPRHAPQAGLRAHLVAKSCCTLTKKSGTAQAIPDFFGRGRRT